MLPRQHSPPLDNLVLPLPLSFRDCLQMPWHTSKPPNLNKFPAYLLSRPPPLGLPIPCFRRAGKCLV
jgi:hypothetical protein